MLGPLVASDGRMPAAACFARSKRGRREVAKASKPRVGERVAARSFGRTRQRLSSCVAGGTAYPNRLRNSESLSIFVLEAWTPPRWRSCPDELQARGPPRGVSFTHFPLGHPSFSLSGQPTPLPFSRRRKSTNGTRYSRAEEGPWRHLQVGHEAPQGRGCAPVAGLHGTPRLREGPGH